MARIVSYATATALLVALLVAGPSMVLQNAAAAGESVTITRQNLPDQACGDTFTVTLSISWSPAQPDSGAISIEEAYPSGWTVTDKSNGGSTSTAGKVKWFLTDVSISQVTYTLQVPGDAEGTFSFQGLYRDHNMESGDPNRVVGGDTSVSVTCSDPTPDPEPDPEPDTGGSATNVTRRAMSSQTCGAQFTVHLDLDWGAAREDATLFIEETYPEGWTVSFPSNGGNVETAGRIKWFLTDTGLSSVNYKLTIPADAAGTFSFSGIFRDDTMAAEDPNEAVGGDDDVGVSCGGGGGGGGEPSSNAQVTRDELINSECGNDLLVQILVSWNDAEEVFVEETYPSGWTVTSTTGGGNTGTAGQVKWFLNDPSVTVISYTLAIPADADGTFSFTGAYRDSLMAAEDPDVPIGGDSDVDITCSSGPGPDPTPSGSVARQIPPICRGSFTVTLTVSPPSGNDAWLVDETVPSGLAVSDISNGGTFNATQGKIKWASTSGASATLSYNLTIPEGTTNGTMYEWNGTYRFDPSMDSRDFITGATTATTACTDIHPFDTDENCVFDDTELFALIDGWKTEDATDDELFSGISAWKLSPGTYCDS